MKKYYFITILLCLQFSCDTNPVTITEEVHSIKTYPFSEPNPIPILTKDERLYPYHQFMGYSHDGKAQDWKVIKMENDHIEVYVLPEVGGKVWGAIDKANGEEFIYRNEVIKFRNIALRGPWTSGGIEFNFGVIGHTPATATAVDYTTRTNPDGSVSTFVEGWIYHPVPIGGWRSRLSQVEPILKPMHFGIIRHPVLRPIITG